VSTKMRPPAPLASWVIRVRHWKVAAAWHLAAGQEHADAVVSHACDSCTIARVPFVDGLTRDVYEDPDGRLWVEGYEGERVSQVWVGPADKPVDVGRTKAA
jgi:hypothetical protein